MPPLHYLDLAAGDANRTSDEPDRQFTVEALSIPQLQAIAGGLAAQPVSSKACAVAEKIAQALAAHQRALLARPPVGFPLTPAAKEHVQACADAWWALGQTYARWGFARAHEINFLAQAIACLSQIVRLYAVYHCRLPKGLWLDLHALFQLTQQATPFRNRGLGQAWRKRVHPQAEYLRAQLLALADPCGLLPHEAILLDSLLEKWVTKVKLADDAEEGWRLDANVDAPAVWGGAGRSRLDWTELAALFTECREFAAPLERFAPWPQPLETIPSGLLERLERSWFHPPVEPAGLAADAELVVGFIEIFARLKGEGSQAIRVRVRDNRAEIGEAPAGGLQVGDLVGVFALNGGDLLSLARLARLEWSETEQGLCVWLEAIPGKGFAVALQPLDRLRQPCAYQRGLLLADKDRLALLLAEQPLAEGTVVRLRRGGRLYPVRLDERRHLARGVLQCRCASAADLVQK